MSKLLTKGRQVGSRDDFTRFELDRDGDSANVIIKRQLHLGRNEAFARQPIANSGKTRLSDDEIWDKGTSSLRQIKVIFRSNMPEADTV